jgi:hypothetical protein
VISKSMVDKVKQELGFEFLTQKEIKCKLQGSSSLIATINLLKISHRNE